MRIKLLIALAVGQHSPGHPCPVIIPRSFFWAGGLLPIDGPQVNASSLFWSLPLFLLSHKARGLLFLGFCQYDMARQPNRIVPVSSDKENIILFFECITLLSPSKVSHRKLRLLRVCISEVTSRLTTLCTMLHTVSSTLSLLRARKLFSKVDIAKTILKT